MIPEKGDDKIVNTESQQAGNQRMKDRWDLNKRDDKNKYMSRRTKRNKKIIKQGKQRNNICESNNYSQYIEYIICE